MRPIYWRYRTDWRGKLILQCMTDPWNNSGPEVGGRIGALAEWRDATAADLTRSDIPQVPVPIRPKAA